MFDKFISIPFENLSTVDDLMLTLKVLSFAFGNFLFRKPLPSEYLDVPSQRHLSECFLIKSIAISQSRFSLENAIIVRYSLWKNACGIDTIFVKMTSNFVNFFFRKKSRKLVKPFEIIVIILKKSSICVERYLFSSGHSSSTSTFVRLVWPHPKNRTLSAAA